VKLLETIDAAARARDPRVAQVSVTLSGSWSVVEIVRADGFVAHRRAPAGAAQRRIVAEANGRRETGSFGIGGRGSMTTCSSPKPGTARSTPRWPRRWSTWKALPRPAGEMTVLLGPGWPGVLLHEAVGHGLEGDFNRKGTSAFSGRIGERVGAPGVTVVDDGSLLGIAGRAGAARSRSTTRARPRAKPC
jgi:TldD protein